MQILPPPSGLVSELLAQKADKALPWALFRNNIFSPQSCPAQTRTTINQAASITECVKQSPGERFGDPIADGHFDLSEGGVYLASYTMLPLNAPDGATLHPVMEIQSSNGTKLNAINPVQMAQAASVDTVHFAGATTTGIIIAGETLVAPNVTAAVERMVPRINHNAGISLNVYNLLYITRLGDAL